MKKHLVISLIFILGCSQPLKIIVEPGPLLTAGDLKTDSPIIKAFVHNCFDGVSISAQLIKYGKNDIDGFCEFLKNGLCYPLSGGTELNIRLDKVKTDYEYYRRINEKNN